jgi:ferredoxin-NADP reductase
MLAAGGVGVTPCIAALKGIHLIGSNDFFFFVDKSIW